jgi:hypothetical protein
MTRLTNTTYLTQHHQLKDEWLSESGGAFIMLSPTEQWTLHSYYEFTKNLTDHELLAHRAAISKARPSLPQTAGKAFARLRIFTERLVEYRAAPHPNTQKKGSPYEVRVFSQVNPVIDPKVMANILIEIARERAHEDRAS